MPEARWRLGKNRQGKLWGSPTNERLRQLLVGDVLLRRKCPAEDLSLVHAQGDENEAARLEYALGRGRTDSCNSDDEAR